MPLAFFGFRHQRADDRLLLPGKTSDGHHQIEQRCGSCHVPFGGVAQEACLRCHQASLRLRGDSHRIAIFDDPGKAADLALFDARHCVTCHREHRPEAHTRGSVTVATTFCLPCHASIGKERPNHADFAADSCAAAGCHNYHDNRVLHRDFLARHKDDPSLQASPRLPAESVAVAPAAPATVGGQFAKVEGEWAASAHGRAAVGCKDCHQHQGSGGPVTAGGSGETSTWAVADTVCAACHAAQREGFVSGKHGMRVAEGLAPMSPGLARARMKAAAAHRVVGCTSCHGAHRFDRVPAALLACEGCHDDDHTRAYRHSPHFLTWQREQAGQAPPGTGVSCASCHLPRFVAREGDKAVVRVQHNQNGNLRPRDRMARDVCLSCHGLPFSLAALADSSLVTSNYAGPPAAIETGMTLMKREEHNDKRH